MISTYLLNLVAGHVMGSKTDIPFPSQLYIGLSGTKPNQDGTGVTEPSSSTGYSRVRLTNLSVPANGVVTNTQLIRFPKSTSAQGTMKYYAVFDAATGGNLLYADDLNPTRVIDVATVLSIDPGALQFKVLDAKA